MFQRSWIDFTLLVVATCVAEPKTSAIDQQSSIVTLLLSNHSFVSPSIALTLSV